MSAPHNRSGSYHGLEVFRFQFDRFAYEHPWIGDGMGEFMLGPSGGGMLEYRNATVFALPDGGAHEVHGEILDYYLAHGGPYGQLGYPSTDEKPTPTGHGRYNQFEHGAIGWLPHTGAFTIGCLDDEHDATVVVPDAASPTILITSATVVVESATK